MRCLLATRCGAWKFPAAVKTFLALIKLRGSLETWAALCLHESAAQNQSGSVPCPSQLCRWLWLSPCWLHGAVPWCSVLVHVGNGFIKTTFYREDYSWYRLSSLHWTSLCLNWLLCKSETTAVAPTAEGDGSSWEANLAPGPGSVAGICSHRFCQMHCCLCI